MVFKKIVSIRLTDKNNLLLQNMGFLDKRNHNTKRKSLSEFINRCIDYFISTERPGQNIELEARVIILNINKLQKQRNKFDDKIKQAAQDLAKIRVRQRPTELDSVENDAEKVLAVLDSEVYS